MPLPALLAAWRSSRRRADLTALLVIAGVFVLFFWPATLRGLLLLTGDALVYSYPLREAAFREVRHGSLPLWTPTILSGYPLLSMAQLALAYPVTWAYLLLPGYWAEQVYVLAPYLLGPAFTYAYLRQVGRSRAAALAGGFSFVYGGVMASSLGHNGMSTNALVWLPLMLIAVDRARAGRFVPCLLGVAGAYALSILTGLGQAFVYAGLVALAYAAFVSLTSPASPPLRRARPLLVCAGGMALAAGLTAFQILESMRAHGLSIRSQLDFATFSKGGLAPLESVSALLWPNLHLGHETPYAPLLAVVLALVAVIAAVRRPSDRRILFWAGLAVAAWLLMMGGHTPLARWTYHVPVFNLFRFPQRHAMEWSFAVSVLAARGLDVLRGWLGRSLASRSPGGWQGGALLGGVVAAGAAWWMTSGLRLATGEPAPITAAPSGWLLAKLVFTLSALAAIAWCCRFRRSPGARATLVASAAGGCLLEGFLLVSSWWFPDAKPASYFHAASPSTRFLEAHAAPDRIYTSVTDYFSLDRSLSEQHNLSALYGFHDAGGYEPLLLERYNRAFEGRWTFQTPWFGHPTDPQVLSPRWHVLDLLDVRYLVDFSSPSSRMAVRFGVPFPERDLPLMVGPGSATTYTGAPGAVDALSIVSALANSSQVAQDEVFARLIIHTRDGRTIERALRAGVDSAEWAHEQPAQEPMMKHRLAAIFDRRGEAALPALRYWTRVSLGERVEVERVELSNLSPASWALDKVTLFDSASGRATMLTRRLPAPWRKVDDRDDVAIYENPRALPRVWLTARAEAVSAEEALRRVRGEGAPFDPRATALLEAPPERLGALGGEALGPEAAASIVIYRPNRLAIQTRAARPAVLVASEIYYPGWEATVDGQRAELFAADYLLRGLVLPAGAHRVEMRYTAPAFRAGAAISLACLLVVAALAAVARRSA